MIDLVYATVALLALLVFVGALWAWVEFWYKLSNFRWWGFVVSMLPFLVIIWLALYSLVVDLRAA
jgi:hypothetical protein